MLRHPYTRASDRRRRRPATVSAAPRLSWRDLPPLPERERVAVPDTPSQTFLKHWDRCHRSAHLYLKHRGGPGSHPLNRGSIFHEVARRLVLEHVIKRGEREIPPDVGKVELTRVFAEHPELTVPADERDYLRMLVYHFCLGSYFDPARVLGVEQMLTLKLGRWTVRGKLDLIYDHGSGMIEITDYKTQRNMPTSEEWATGGHDPRTGLPRFGGDFQTQVYGVLCAFGVDEHGMTIGEQVNRWRLVQRFPSTLWEEGIGYREADVDRVQLADFRDDVLAQLEALEHAIATGKWQPTPGTHCGECPAEYECPLPRHLRPDSQGASIDTLEEAERLAAFRRFSSRRQANLTRALRKAAERNGWERIYSGADTALVFIPEHRESLKPKSLPNLRADVEAAARYGHGLEDDGSFDLSKYTKTSQSTRFDERKVEPKGARNGD